METKADASPVTIADKQAETTMRELLSKVHLQAWGPLWGSPPVVVAGVGATPNAAGIGVTLEVTPNAAGMGATAGVWGQPQHSV